VSIATLERTAFMTDLEVEILEELDESTDDGQGDGLAHYVHQDKIIAATFHGIPAFALCGKRWVPTRHPEGLPVCPKCAEIYADPSNFKPEDNEEDSA
jgi:hypothetical protein